MLTALAIVTLNGVVQAHIAKKARRDIPDTRWIKDVIKK